MSQGFGALNLNLNGAKISLFNPGLLPYNNGVSQIHQQQLQHEPESAKCFLYRTEMHLKQNNAKAGHRKQPSSTFTSPVGEDILPALRHHSGGSKGRCSRPPSGYVVQAIDAAKEAEIIRQALVLEKLKLSHGVPPNAGVSTHTLLTDLAESRVPRAPSGSSERTNSRPPTNTSSKNRLSTLTLSTTISTDTVHQDTHIQDREQMATPECK